MNATIPIAVCPCEAARLTGLSRSTIDRLVKRGELESRRIGRTPVIPFVALERLVQGRVDPDPDDGHDIGRWHDDGGAARPRTTTQPESARP